MVHGLIEMGETKESMMELGLKQIENRLTNVEDTLKTILEKGDSMEENLQEKMSVIQEEIEKNAKMVRRMQRKMSQYQPKSILLLLVGIVLLWSFVLRYLFS